MVLKPIRGEIKRTCYFLHQKIANQKNKEKGLNVLLLCKSRLLLTVRNVVTESEYIQYKDVPTHMFTHSENFPNLNFANH